MSISVATVSCFASLQCWNPEARRIANDFAQSILGDPRLIGNFVEAGIIPAVLQKFDECDDDESRVCFAGLMRTLTVQTCSHTDTQIQLGISRARQELCQLGALFVMVKVLRFEGFHQNLWLIVSDTMTAVLHQMDYPSMPFNVVAVPFLILHLSQSWAPWQVYSCASMLRSCLGIRHNYAAVDSILEHAFSAGCLPVLIEKLHVCCGQDGNQPIASILNALIRLPHIRFCALHLDIVPALLANVASPQPKPSTFIHADCEWSDELEYHQVLVRILLSFVQSPIAFENAPLQGMYLQGVVTLLGSNCIPVLVDRLWCKTSSKILAHMASRIERAACSQNRHLMSCDDSERFFAEYSNALLAKLAEMISQAQQLDGAQSIDTCAKMHLALAKAIAGLSELSCGRKAVLESNGGIAIVAKFLRSVMDDELSIFHKMPMHYPNMRIRLYAVSRHGESVMAHLLSTLHNLVQVRRGTKGAIAAGLFQTMTTALRVDTSLEGEESGQQETHQLWNGSHLNIIAAEMLARISSITKGQRQVTTVAPSILMALCVHATETLSLLTPLVEVLENIASTADGLYNLAYCNAAPVLQYVRELMALRHPSTHDENEQKNVLEEKLHSLEMLVNSQQRQLSSFLVKVSDCCTFAASNCLIWPEGNCVTESKLASKPKTCSIATESAVTSLIISGLGGSVTVFYGAFIGILAQRIGEAVDISLRRTIVEYCISKTFNPIRVIQNKIGSRNADDCISVQAWIKNHELTVTAARMIKEMLEGNGAWQFVRNQPQMQWIGHIPIEMVAAKLQDRIQLPKGCDASAIARSAVSIFSPLLAMLTIGTGGSEFVILCQAPKFQWREMCSESQPRIGAPNLAPV